MVGEAQMALALDDSLVGKLITVGVAIQQAVGVVYVQMSGELDHGPGGSLHALPDTPEPHVHRVILEGIMRAQRVVSIFHDLNRILPSIANPIVLLPLSLLGAHLRFRLGVNQSNNRTLDTLL